MLGGDGDPDRDRRLHLLFGDDERLGQCLERALGELVDVELVGQPGQEDGELVATHPGHGVLAADRLHQAVAHLLDQLVAGGMAEGVVDRLEVVDVDEEHAHRLAHPPRAHELLLHAVLEQPPVGEPGQGVVPGHVRDLLEQVEVLESGGGLIGQPGQPFVDVRVPVGGLRGTDGRSWRPACRGAHRR